MRNLLIVLGFAGAFTTLIIGMHQAYFHGIANSYFFFAFSIGFLFLLSYARRMLPEKEENEKPKEKTPKKGGYKNKNQPHMPRSQRRRMDRENKKKN